MLGQNPNKPYADFTPAYLQSLGLQKSDGSSNAGSAGTTACAAANNTQWWFNNYCGASSGVNGAPIVASNGQIPLSQLDPNMLAIASLFPKPNITPTSGNPFNYQFVNSTPQNRWEAKIRGDWNITPKNRLYVSYNRQDETDINNFGVWWWPSDTLPYPSTMPAKQVSNLWSASFVHEFTTSLTNETVFNYTSFLNPVRPTDLSTVDPTKVNYGVTPPFGYPGITPVIPNMVSWGNQTGSGGWFPGLVGASVCGHLPERSIRSTEARSFHRGQPFLGEGHAHHEVRILLGTWRQPANRRDMGRFVERVPARPLWL